MNTVKRPAPNPLFFIGTLANVLGGIDIAKGPVIRDKRMVGEKDGGTCKKISHAQSGFEE